MTQDNRMEAKDRTRIDAVSKALASIYTGAFLIDLKNDRYTIVKATDGVRHLLGGIVSAQQAINVAIKKTVTEESIVDMITFVNLDTLSTRMKSERVLNIDYKGVVSGWVRGSFIEAERDENGLLVQVLYTYQVIDGEKRKELDDLQELKDSYAQSEKANKAKTIALEADNQVLADDLLYRNNFIKVVMEQLNCGVLVYTIPGRDLLEINREALRIFGWKDREDAATNLSDNWRKVSLANASQEMELLKLRDGEGSVIYQFAIRDEEGEKQILAESKSLAGRHGGRSSCLRLWT